MDAEVLVQALTNTLDPQGREQAEAVLEKVSSRRLTRVPHVPLHYRNDVILIHASYNVSFIFFFITFLVVQASGVHSLSAPDCSQ